MKVIFKRSALLAGALLVLAAVPAHANTITPDLVSFLPGVSITYNARFSSGELHSGDGFTIFDIGGFLGFPPGTLPAGWTASSSIVGSPFGTSLGPDSAGLRNVHFTYTGPAIEAFDIATTVTFVPFTVLTSSLTLVTDDWVSRDHLLGTAGVIDGGVAGQHEDNILVPFGVPDGGSTVALLGSVLLGFGMLRRKLSKS